MLTEEVRVAETLLIESLIELSIQIVEDALDILAGLFVSHNSYTMDM